MRHLILNLESPLMSFGGEAIDNYGVTRRFPAASMLTGLFANAMGWRRTERARHQRLQERLVFAARIEREPAGGLSMRDFQTAQLGANDKGWTTLGVPEDRAGGASTYKSPALRYRDYYADARVVVALHLRDPDEHPTLADLAAALNEPARPLFIGRKSCLPSAPLIGRKLCWSSKPPYERLKEFEEGDTALAALRATPLVEPDAAPPLIPLLWPEGEDADGVDSSNFHMLTDQRNWASGLHGGGRWVHEGSLPASAFAPAKRAGSDGED